MMGQELVLTFEAALGGRRVPKLMVRWVQLPIPCAPEREAEVEVAGLMVHFQFEADAVWAVGLVWAVEVVNAVQAVRAVKKAGVVEVVGPVESVKDLWFLRAVRICGVEAGEVLVVGRAEKTVNPGRTLGTLGVVEVVEGLAPGRAVRTWRVEAAEALVAVKAVRTLVAVEALGAAWAEARAFCQHLLQPLVAALLELGMAAVQAMMWCLAEGDCLEADSLVEVEADALVSMAPLL